MPVTQGALSKLKKRTEERVAAAEATTLKARLACERQADHRKAEATNALSHPTNNNKPYRNLTQHL
jgi:hypothetical protein